MKIQILGTEYTAEYRNRQEDKRLENSDGLCDDSTKEIALACLEADADSKRDLEAVRRRVLRHEIIHAFLFESGLAESSEWAQNEEIVDWIAIQGPKILQAWQEAGAV